MSTNYTNFANHNSKNSALQIELMMAGALGCVIVLITISILCERFCCRRPYLGRTAPAAVATAHNTHNNQSSGVCLSVIANLPTFAYKRSHGGDLDHGVPHWLQCVVCLCLVQEGEQVRQLPACRHFFHQECIDMWLYLHSTCPICRLTVADAAVGQEKDGGMIAPSPVLPV